MDVNRSSFFTNGLTLTITGLADCHVCRFDTGYVTEGDEGDGRETLVRKYTLDGQIVSRKFIYDKLMELSDTRIIYAYPPSNVRAYREGDQLDIVLLPLRKPSRQSRRQELFKKSANVRVQ